MGRTIPPIVWVAAVAVGLPAVLVLAFITDRMREDRYYWDSGRAHSDLRTLASALEIYRLDNGRYPLGSEGLAAVSTPLAYLTSEPTDIFSPDGEGFRYLSNGVDFILISRGPDRVFAEGLSQDLLSQPWEEGLEILRLVTYDPTNGVPSPGDIWRSSLQEREASKGRAWVFDKNRVPVPSWERESRKGRAWVYNEHGVPVPP